jgi:hypothetical protein
VDGVERIRSVRGNGYVYANQSRSEPQ